MKALVRSSLAAVVAVVAFVLPAAALAAPPSTAFSIVGYEYAFTQTVGTFAGWGSGNAGDTGLWNGRVEHDPLGSLPTYINGGSFAMTTRSPGGSLDFVTGAFAYHGGAITTLDRGANCTNQRYLVAGRLEHVATRTSSDGTGRFSVTLTHYRHRIFGHCIIYKARVAGGVSFSY